MCLKQFFWPINVQFIDNAQNMTKFTYVRVRQIYFITYVLLTCTAFRLGYCFKLSKVLKMLENIHLRSRTYVIESVVRLQSM